MILIGIAGRFTGPWEDPDAAAGRRALDDVAEKDPAISYESVKNRAASSSASAPKPRRPPPLVIWPPYSYPPRLPPQICSTTAFARKESLSTPKIEGAKEIGGSSHPVHHCLLGSALVTTSWSPCISTDGVVSLQLQQGFSIRRESSRQPGWPPKPPVQSQGPLSHSRPART